MPFDYFNTSHLAFGSKLTKAFRQLEKLCANVEEHLGDYEADLAYLDQYVNRNYRIPFPNSPNNPVQVNQILDVINDEINIRDLNYDGTSFRCSIVYFNRANNRFTVGVGSTNLKKGYAFMRESLSNSNPSSQVIFSENDDKKGIKLFKFRIDSIGRINLTQVENSIINFKVGDIKHITSLRLESISLPHTATDYESIIVTGNLVYDGNSVDVSVNSGEQKVLAGGTTCSRYVTVNLKPSDVLTSSVHGNAYKIIYE